MGHPSLIRQWSSFVHNLAIQKIADTLNGPQVINRFPEVYDQLNRRIIDRNCKETTGSTTRLKMWTSKNVLLPHNVFQFFIDYAQDLKNSDSTTHIHRDPLPPDLDGGT